MGPAPNLADYQSAAQAADAPLEAAEQTTDAATHQANLNTLTEQQSEIGPQYDQALEALQTQLTGETGALNQKYTEALQGNFSGLQGNDLGMLYSKANQDVTSIQTQRANALNEVSTKISNENLTYNANESALTSKYQGEEASDANSAYDTALNQYNTQQAELEREEISASGSGGSGLTEDELLGQEEKYKAIQTDTGHYNFTNANGQPISMAEYIAGSGQGSGAVLDLLQNGTAYDKNVYNSVKNLTGDALESALGKYSVYGF